MKWNDLFYIFKVCSDRCRKDCRETRAQAEPNYVIAVVQLSWFLVAVEVEKSGWIWVIMERGVCPAGCGIIWLVWLRSIQCLVFLLNLVLPVSFLEDEGLAFRILGDKRGNRPQGAQQPIHMNSLNSWFQYGNSDPTWAWHPLHCRDVFIFLSRFHSRWIRYSFVGEDPGIYFLSQISTIFI